MVSIQEICEDDANKAEVENSSGFIYYQLAFMLAYGALFCWCSFMLAMEWKKQQKIVCNNNRYQVVMALAVGCFVRIFSFLEVNCVFEEVFRSLKDVFFVMAFVLVVLFWIELQTGMRAMKSIQRLKPWLIGVMVVYAVFRVMASIADLFISGGVKNAFMGVCILIYAGVMGVGLYYGCSLLNKMKTTQRTDIQARLQKLTRFIIYENVVLIIFLFAYLVRTVVFKKKKETDPWMWFYLKLIEKVLEYLAIVILCLTMTSKSAKKKSKAQSARNRRTPSQSQAARRRQQERVRAARSSKKATTNGGGGGGSAKSSGGESDGVALVSMGPTSGADGPWVEAKAQGKTYYFHAETKESKWSLPAGARRMSVAAYKQRQAKQAGRPMQDVEEGSVNPLNVDVSLPPPPSAPAENGGGGNAAVQV